MPPCPPVLPGALKIGEPFKIVAHYPTVVVQCQCEAKSIVVLVGPQNVNTCPACKHRFVILDEMKVGIGAMRPVAESSLVSQ